MIIRTFILGFLMLGFSTVVGCQDTQSCSAICKRVASCREAASKSPEKVLGEKEPPPNPKCMERCEAGGEHFSSCEGTKRTCPKLRECLGSDFGD